MAKKVLATTRLVLVVHDEPPTVRYSTELMLLLPSFPPATQKRPARAMLRDAINV